jgi:hypothetical protein
MSSFLKTPVRPAEEVSEQATNDLLSLVRQASEGSKREIDLLIKELTGLQKKLDDDRERAHQQVAQYTSLSQSTLQLTKIVLDQIPHVKKQSNPNHGSS